MLSLPYPCVCRIEYTVYTRYTVTAPCIPGYGYFIMTCHAKTAIFLLCPIYTEKLQLSVIKKKIHS